MGWGRTDIYKAVAHAHARETRARTYALCVARVMSAYGLDMLTKRFQVFHLNLSCQSAPY